MQTGNTTRLSALIARAAPVGVIFRRGPSQHVLLVRRDLATDAFEAGQWLKGRVYERRCDLSPSGDRLIYFAANYGGPVRTWTAISRPPYFTALAMWPKGDAWGGGGLFSRENEIRLNHPDSALDLAEGTHLPKQIQVSPMPYSGAGEDDPICSERMARDGWSLLQTGRWQQQSHEAPVWLTSDPPETWRKDHPDRSVSWKLQMRTLGIHEHQGPWYVTSYEIVDETGRVRRDLGRADWADWQSSGDLLFGRDGKIYRIAFGSDGRFDPDLTPRELIDLSALRFEAREPVPSARLWDGPRPQGVRLSAF